MRIMMMGISNYLFAGKIIIKVQGFADATTTNCFPCPRKSNLSTVMILCKLYA